MNKRLVFYVDLLGSKAAMTDTSKIRGLTDLLHKIASTRGRFRVLERRSKTGRSFTMRPSISTFSDHMVMSYRTQRLSDFVSQNIISTAFATADKLLSSLALEALSLGLLIRGGAAFGELHHEGGVVVGSAMLEAYRLESELAIYPRIAVSPDLCSRLQDGIGSLCLLDDADGIAHYNYFRSMITVTSDPLKVIVKVDVEKIIQQNIRALRSSRKAKELAKWEWLAHTLERVRLDVERSVLQSRPT